MEWRKNMVKKPFPDHSPEHLANVVNMYKLTGEEKTKSPDTLAGKCYKTDWKKNQGRVLVSAGGSLYV